MKHMRTSLSIRPKRRQLLRGAVGLTAGSAAFLVACSGDDAEERTPAEGASTVPAQATAAAAATPAPKRGGRLRLNYQDNTTNLNPAIDVGQRLNMAAFHVYDRLISQRLGKDTAKE